jgi:hypothetical protein
MNAHITFPEDLITFLMWVKTKTEYYWSRLAMDAPMYGAKWIGLSDEQIDGLEHRYSIKFGTEHRAFLKVLHTIDKDLEEDYDPADNSGRNKPSMYYNWLTDTEWIENRLRWPYQTILQDVLGVNSVWLQSWGPRLHTEEEKRRAFDAWYAKAPLLFPITAHTFLMDDTGEGLKPVLSVYGSDTIVSGWSLRHWLMREFSDALDLTRMVYQKEADEEYAYMVKGIPELDALERIVLQEANIPVWKEVITYWSCSWTTFWAEDDE